MIDCDFDKTGCCLEGNCPNYIFKRYSDIYYDEAEREYCIIIKGYCKHDKVEYKLYKLTNLKPVLDKPVDFTGTDVSFTDDKVNCVSKYLLTHYIAGGYDENV